MRIRRLYLHVIHKQGLYASRWYSETVLVYQSSTSNVHEREKRSSWYPEDRLRASIWGALVFVPYQHYFPGYQHNIFMGHSGWSSTLFASSSMNSGFVDLTLSPAAAYI
ncbi:hypothetical protein BDN72DRAFT_846445, partial [Pluteus cervinus]